MELLSIALGTGLLAMGLNGLASMADYYDISTRGIAGKMLTLSLVTSTWTTLAACLLFSSLTLGAVLAQTIVFLTGLPLK
jgi:hypothetical protein